jgi:hypothetical protein
VTQSQGLSLELPYPMRLLHPNLSLPEHEVGLEPHKMDWLDILPTMNLVSGIRTSCLMPSSSAWGT